MSTAPRFIRVVGFVAVAGFILAVVVAWKTSEFAVHQRQRDCERAVAVREDGRAMWLYLLDTADPDNERAPAFVAELNKRLPPLECVDGKPVSTR